jgi:integrase
MARSKRRRKLWSVARIGDPRYPGIRVRITELAPGGTLYAVRMVDGKQRMASLKCTRKELGATATEQIEEAKAKALSLIEELARGESMSAVAVEAKHGAAVTLGTVAELYEVHGFHGKSDKYRKEQPAKVRRIVTHVGADRDVRSLCRTDVEAYTAHRKAKGARQGTVASDVAALKIALNWATEFKRSDGTSLIEVNPLAKLKVEQEKRPRRPVANEDRYAALKTVAHELPAAFGVALDLVWGTGRRIGAVLALRWQDVILDPKAAAVLAKELDDDFPWTPADFVNGGIRWYAERETDNKAHDQVVPMTPLARAALDRARPDIVPPAAWVFPATKDAEKPLGYHVIKGWLRKAERKAKLPHLKGGGFHPYRRGWATAHKHYPSADVAKLGGWRDEGTMRKCYVQADTKTIRAIVNGG